MNAVALGAPPGGRALPPLWPADEGRRARWALVGVAASVALHLGAFAALGSLRRPDPRPAAARRVIEIETIAPRPAAPPAPAPEPPAPAPTPAKAERAPKAAARAAAAAPPPSPARAGRTLSAQADAGAVADFTMVQGAADAYAGGVTSSAGTSKAPVTGAASDAGPPASQPARGQAGPAAADLSQAAKPEGSDWDCSSLFPPDASVNVAHVLLAVRVDPDGRARSVSVLSDPGEGFGAAARACALRQRYRPALDRDGKPTAAQTAPFRVRFTR
ncbi:MAG TPA: energy transducer TonB [Polyangiaceae bacterium]|nr:energy transducer TonB [Polyangiaceae bacterium]